MKTAKMSAGAREFFAAALFFLFGATASYGQVTPPASPFVSNEHWSHRVLRRLDHAGMLPRGADIARQSIPQEEIATLFAAADSANGTHYLEEFRKDFHAPKVGKYTELQAEGRVGLGGISGGYAPGIGYDTLAWSGARAKEDDVDFLFGVAVGGSWAPHFALGLSSRSFDQLEAQLVMTKGYFGAWLGQRRLGYGVGDGGGLVLDSYLTRDRISPQFGLFLPRPLQLPLLGPVRFEMHAGRLENVLNFQGSEREIEPWFWTARGSFEPFEFVRVGINRGMIFGGEGNTPTTFSRVAKNIIGIYTDDGESNFANQIISVDFRLRVPGVPVIAYLDWGSDDAAGGWWDVPMILGGLEYARVMQNYDVAIGIEHTQFSRSCCSNSILYRNNWFRGGWADDETLLGHPLGGHGREWRLFANGSARGGSVNGNAAVFARRRGVENLFVPAWEGKSLGIEAGADVEITGPTRLDFNGEIEWGENDWTTSRWSAALRVRL